MNKLCQASNNWFEICEETILHYFRIKKWTLIFDRLRVTKWPSSFPTELSSDWIGIGPGLCHLLIFCNFFNKSLMIRFGESWSGYLIGYTAKIKVLLSWKCIPLYLFFCLHIESSEGIVCIIYGPKIWKQSDLSKKF